EIKRSTDLIFCWWWTFALQAVSVAAIRHRPVVVTGVFDLPTFRDRPVYQQWAMGTAARRASANVFVSRFERDGVCRELGLKSGDYSPLVVDTGIYRPAPDSVSSGKDELLIANVCWKRRSNIKRKRLPQLIRAMATIVRRIPQVRLVLAGPPEDGEAGLRQLVGELGLERWIEFRGDISREEKIQLYRSCDVYVQCSEYEGFGVA